MSKCLLCPLRSRHSLVLAVCLSDVSSVSFGVCLSLPSSVLVSESLCLSLWPQCINRTLTLGQTCRGPALVGSRGTLRLNGVRERERERERQRERERERERDQTGGMQQGLAMLYFLLLLLYPKLVHF